MTKKVIHLDSKLIIVDPYVVMYDHCPDNGTNFSYAEFRKILKMAKEICAKSWGYSNPELESRYLSKEEADKLGLVAGVPWGSSLVSYWAFSDREDALQFRLTAGNLAKQVHIWPSTITFTIFEIVE